MFSHPQIPFVLRVQQVSDSFTVNLHVTHLERGICMDNLVILKAFSIRNCSIQNTTGVNSPSPLQESCRWVSQFVLWLDTMGEGKKSRESHVASLHYKLQTLHPCIDPSTISKTQTQKHSVWIKNYIFEFIITFHMTHQQNYLERGKQQMVKSLLTSNLI